MLATVGIISSIVMSLGAIVVAVVTNMNHVQHLKKDFEDFRGKSESDKIRMWDAIEKEKEARLNLAGEVERMQGVCDERHKKGGG